jgi:hypothetical protein
VLAKALQASALGAAEHDLLVLKLWVLNGELGVERIAVLNGIRDDANPGVISGGMGGGDGGPRHGDFDAIPPVVVSRLEPCQGLTPCSVLLVHGMRWLLPGCLLGNHVHAIVGVESFRSSRGWMPGSQEGAQEAEKQPIPRGYRSAPGWRALSAATA